MPSSMTGFARLEVQYPWGHLSCEIRSVNHRYLEPSLRIPEMMRILEPGLREELRKRLNRGKLEASLYLKTENSANTGLALNEPLAEQIIEIARQVQSKMGESTTPSPLDILRWPGVIQNSEVDADTLKAAVMALFSDTLSQLIENRQREGVELRQMIEVRLDQIAAHVIVVRERLPQILEAYTEKLRSRLDALKVEVDEQRFNQEVIYVSQKSDVAEELDRLDAHLTEVRHTLNQKGPIGRRLDFLMQELNREANTLSSKSMSSDTSQIAVELKVLIEQMREQVQNIE